MQQGDLMNRDFVDWLCKNKIINEPRVRDAFYAIPRHLFLPGVPYTDVYKNVSVVTKREDRISVSSSTKPGVIAVMLEQLEILPGNKILEIGTGTGFNAALMSELVGDQGLVVTIDIDQQIVDQAKENLSNFNKHNIRVLCRDGWEGFPDDNIVFDRIIFTVGLNEIPLYWQHQLSESGITLLPIWLKNGLQRTVAFNKDNGILKSKSIKKCDFMRLRGAMAGNEGYAYLNKESSLITGVENINDNQYLEKLSNLLSLGFLEGHFDAEYTLSGQKLEDFIFYCGLNKENCIIISDYGGNDEFFSNSTLGLYDIQEESLFLVRYDRPDCNLTRQYGNNSAKELFFQMFGEWKKIGKPGDSELHISIIPEIQQQLTNGGFLINKNNCSILYMIKTSANE